MASNCSRSSALSFVVLQRCAHFSSARAYVQRTKISQARQKGAVYQPQKDKSVLDLACFLEMRVRAPGNGLRLRGAANLLELVMAQADLRALDILFQVTERRGTGDGQDCW